MRKTQAAVVREKGGPFLLETLELDDPHEGEVLVRIAGVGLCHTDLSVREQYMPLPLPIVLGHEGAGVVERVGPGVTRLAPGDQVVLTFPSCGSCRNCQHDQGTYCTQLAALSMRGTHLDGAMPYRDERGESVRGFFSGQSSFSAHALVHERAAVKVPKGLPLHLLGPMGCSLQTGAGAVLNVLRPTPHDSIAVFGAGAVGLAAIMAARVVGCSSIIAVDLNPARLSLARELGATHTVHAGSEDAVTRIREMTGGEGAQFSLDCTGVPKVVRQAVESLRITGVCGLMGMAPMGTELALDMNAVLFGRTLRGIIEGDSVPERFIPELIQLWRQGYFPFDKLIQTYPLSRIEDAARAAARGEVIKAVMIPD